MKSRSASDDTQALGDQGKVAPWSQYGASLGKRGVETIRGTMCVLDVALANDAMAIDRRRTKTAREHGCAEPSEIEVHGTAKAITPVIETAFTVAT